MSETTPSAASTRETVNPYLSQKLKLLSFVAMICVVFIHAYNYTDTFLQPSTMLTEGLSGGPIVQFLISNALARFATPLFFAISGYLFFAAFGKFTFKKYFVKLGNRARTVLLPYAIWVALWTGIAALTVWAVGMDYFPILNEKLGKLFAGEWWRVLNDPVPFQAWYLLDLFKLAILSPIIYFAVKYLRWGAPLIFAVLWAMDYSIPYYFPNCDGMFFFTLGAYFAVREIKFPGKEHPIKRNALSYIIPCVWVALCITYAMLSAAAKQINVPWYVLSALYKLNQILGFCSVFILYDFVSDKVIHSKFVNVVASGSFFVYILHEPLQHMMFQLVLKYTNADWAHMLCYFVLPATIIATAIGLSVGIRALCPKLHSVLTGGR